MFSIKMTDPVVLFIMNFPTVAHLIERWTKKPLFHQDIWDYFETTLSSMMEQRMNEPDAANKYQDALQLMLNAMEDGHTEIGAEDADMVSETVAKNRPKKSLSKVEVMAQLILFLVAGYETTASTLHFVCYILANCPEIQEKLREEVVEVVDGRESIEYEDMTKLEYMNQVISETLRMYPPAVRINRLCQKDVEVDGIHFEKGTCFSFDVYNIHHDPANYPDPEEFDPERFSKENRQARHPMAFLPFGAGPRICLGMRFAEFEMRVALTDLIRNFKFLPTEGMPGLPVKIISQSLLKPAVELKCKVERL
uniref:Cytochrome P450 n=1 Tax=Panagrolaimus sp. JU765 TaxID=591449 RepID=A0AC34R7U3_9BILA